ncbi:MAG: peptidylprolyl isomerase [Clostridia bacterium]|nr:peptidylprolyl isomerase [Clostridia bacterium]
MSGYRKNNGSDSGNTGNNKRKLIFIAACGAVLVVLIALISVFIIGCSAKNKKSGVDKGKAVMTVDGTVIYENQFRFFASLVLNQENTVYTLLTEDNIDANATVKNSVVNFAKEYIFRLRECGSAGLSLTEEEKNQVLDSIKNEYEQFKTVDGKTYEGDSFYEYYYGLTEDQYTGFWLDWALIEKYNTLAEDQADVSEENQRAAYDFFETYLYGREITVISLSLKGKSEDGKTIVLTLARELKEQIENGADMTGLVRKHCDDEALKETEGKVTVTSIMNEYFPELYDWSINAPEGTVEVIVSDEAVYVAKAGPEQNYESMKNSELMLEWTRMYVVDRQIDELVNSGKYSFSINDGVYNTIDLSEMIENSLKSWRSYYAQLEAGDL